MYLDGISDELDAISGAPDAEYRIATYRRKLAEFPAGHAERAEYLTYLADDLTAKGDLEEARETYEAAIADGGKTTLNPRSGMLTVALRSGDEAWITEMLDTLMQLSRKDGLVIGDYGWIGEALEESGRFREALRWFTIPLRDLQPGHVDRLPLICLNGRYRTRRELGMPLDAYDDAHDMWIRLDTQLDEPNEP
ncbi:hypothetical protein [Aeromicrobium sp. UC242_57]|uniref:hypothetical protein n=1 Tax=Aeromicrobium sp. UC242_57 TaxID=3374624 RepID=UPI00378AC20D